MWKFWDKAWRSKWRIGTNGFRCGDASSLLTVSVCKLQNHNRGTEIVGECGVV